MAARPRPQGGDDGRGGGGGGRGGGDEEIPDLRNPDGSPSRSNPSLTETCPGAAARPARLCLATSVPNFIIEKFRVPIFLLPIYQAAGTQYGSAGRCWRQIKDRDRLRQKPERLPPARSAGCMSRAPGASYGWTPARTG